jgi:hypothetical protein
VLKVSRYHYSSKDLFLKFLVLSGGLKFDVPHHICSNRKPQTEYFSRITAIFLNKSNISRRTWNNAYLKMGQIQGIKLIEDPEYIIFNYLLLIIAEPDFMFSFVKKRT